MTYRLLDEQPAKYRLLEPEAPSLGDQAKRAGGLLARSTLDAIAGLPLAALEGGAGIGNMITGGDFSPRRTWSEGLDKLGLPRPETGLEKASDFGSQLILGSRVPATTGQASAPANFVKPKSMQTQALEAAQAEGYVVPPATSNPNAVTRTLEGVAGKLTTAQMASAKNTNATNRLARKALGMQDDAPITTEALQAIRAEAGKAYAALKGLGQVASDDAFRADLGRAVEKYQGAGKDFPTLARADLQTIADDLAGAEGRQIDSSSAVDAIAVLREKADAAFASGDKAVGKAYREFAAAVEGLLERTLAQTGDESALAAFRAAREAIAKTYSVEKALNATTGNVSATKLAQQLAKGKPLSGPLKTAAQFGQAFPKAAREFNESLPGISPLDFYASGGTATLGALATGGNPAAALPLLYPFARVGTRAGLLSPMGQRLAVPGPGIAPQPGMAAGAGTGLFGMFGY